MQKSLILLLSTLALVPCLTLAEITQLGDDIDSQLQFLDTSNDLLEPLDDSDTGTLWPWLTVGITHKLGLNPASGWTRHQNLTELNLTVDTNIGLTSYGRMHINASQHWAGDSDKPAGSHYSRLGLEQALIQHSLDDWYIKLGLYTIDWGETAIGSPLNVINPETSMTNINLSPEPQWLVSAAWYWPDGNLVGFINPRAQVTELDQVTRVAEPRHEFGLRYNLTEGRGDTALYLAHLVPNTVLLDLSNNSGRASSYQMAGLSLTRSWGESLFTFDLAWKYDLQHNTKTGLQRADRLDVALGLELTEQGQQWLINIMANHWLDFQPDFLTPVSVLPTPLNTARSSLSYLLDISDTWMHELIGWQVTYMGTFDGAMHMVSAQLDWDISDQWQVSLDWLRMYADNNSLYSALNGHENVALELTYQY